MRERIYSLSEIKRVDSTLRQDNLHAWGTRDLDTPTDLLVHDYTFVSLVYQKAVTP
jgi:hypothetical protein